MRYIDMGGRRDRRFNYYVIVAGNGKYLRHRHWTYRYIHERWTYDLSDAWFTLDNTTAAELAYSIGMSVMRLVAYE